MSCEEDEMRVDDRSAAAVRERSLFSFIDDGD